MIVVDTNVIVYLHIQGEWTDQARNALQLDPDWRSADLWRAEFLNVLWTHIRHSALGLPDAFEAWRSALDHMEGFEVVPDEQQILLTAVDRGITTYDARFVVAARTLGTRLITADRQLALACPEDVVTLDSFC